MLVRRGCEVVGDKVGAGGHGEGMRRAGKVGEVIGSLGEANDAAIAGANVVRESIEESSALVAKEGGGATMSTVQQKRLAEMVLGTRLATIDCEVLNKFGIRNVKSTSP
jgi:hypothetical protein